MLAGLFTLTVCIHFPPSPRQALEHPTRQGEGRAMQAAATVFGDSRRQGAMAELKRNRNAFPGK